MKSQWLEDWPFLEDPITRCKKSFGFILGQHSAILPSSNPLETNVDVLKNNIKIQEFLQQFKMKMYEIISSFFVFFE